MGHQRGEMISVELDDVKYYGTFTTANGVVTVRTAHTHRSNPVGSVSADTVARILLRDIVLSRRQHQ